MILFTGNIQAVTMSKYEDYSEVSKVYDKERTAMGADTIVGLLHVHGAKPLKVRRPQARI